jgi:Xaa-Pro aminopeptidase
MFPVNVYVERRSRLREQVKSGLILFLGNEESPMNYQDNQYSFRQDSSFLYFFGLNFPSLAAIIDVDRDKEIIFGDDLTVDDIIWTGPQPALNERAQEVGVHETAPVDKLKVVLEKAVQQDGKIHFLPQYRAENILKIERLLGTHPTVIQDYVSETLIRTVVAQRSLKSKEEIEQIEAALDVSYEMQTAAMKMSRPGMLEMEVVGAMEGIAISSGCRLAFIMET